MLLRAIVAEIAGARPFAALDDAWHFGAATGAHTFDFVLALGADGARAFQMNSRDRFDEALVATVIAHARAHEGVALAAAPVAVLAGFSAPGWSFDTVVAVAPAVHRVHQVERPALHAATIAVFPSWRCEFNGRETEREATLRFARMVDTSNVGRRPDPLIRMRYKNARTRGRSTGRALGIAPLDTLLGELRKLDGADGSFVEIENFEGSRRRVTFDGGRHQLWDDDTACEIAADALIPWAERFVARGGPGLRQSHQKERRTAKKRKTPR